MSTAPIEEVIITKSIALPHEKRFPKIHQVSVAGLLATAIRSIHFNEWVSRVFE